MPRRAYSLGRADRCSRASILPRYPVMRTTPMPRPTDAASAIAAGLIRSGRAQGNAEMVGKVIRLPRMSGGYYWISFDGSELRQGMTLGDAELLQPSFALAMLAAGRRIQAAGLSARSRTG